MVEPTEQWQEKLGASNPVKILPVVKIFLCFTFRYKSSIYTLYHEFLVAVALTRTLVKTFALILQPDLPQQ